MSTPTNVQTTGGGALGSSLTSATYTVASGNNQRLVVFVGGSVPTSASLSSAPSCSHNGVAMTLRATSQSNNANGGGSSSSTLWMFDLLLGSTTPSGTINASWTLSMRASMVAMTLSNITQSGGPTVATSQSLGTDSVASATTDTVIDAVENAAQNTTTGYAVTVAAGQTQLSNNRANSGSGSEVNLASSYANSPGASTTAMLWTGAQSSGPRSQHIVAGYAAVAGGSGVTVNASGRVDGVLGSTSMLAVATAGAALALDADSASAGAAVTVTASAAAVGLTTGGASAFVGVTASAIAGIQTGGNAFTFVGVAATGAALTATTGTAGISGTVAGRALNVIVQLGPAAGTAAVSLAVVGAGAGVTVATSSAASLLANVVASAAATSVIATSAGALALATATGAAQVTTGGAGTIAAGGVAVIVFTPSIDRTTAAGDARQLTAGGDRLTFAAPRIISGD